MQWPAVIIVSGLTSVTLHVDIRNPATLFASTWTIMPTARATVLRMSPAGVTQAAFSQFGGSLQNQKCA